MAAQRPESTVMVRPFVRNHEGNEVVISDPDRGVYLAIPREALDILDSLAAGETVGEAARRYEEKHGETPDVEDFIDVLSAEGFVRRHGQPAEPLEEPHQHGRGARRTRTISLNWISPALSRPLTTTPAVLLYAGIIAVAFGLFLSDPSVLPPTKVLLFPHGSFAVLAVVTVVVCLAGSFVHELAHAVVARASGVPVTLGISNLMYTVVAQTNITGMRKASKGQLYLAFLAGSIVDLVFASLVFFVLYANQHGAIALSPNMQDLVGAILLGYLFRVSFQLQFYLRTDIYYVFATALRCRNLMSDTERVLKSWSLRLVGKRAPRFDMSRLARRERLAIRGYTVLYLLGRTYAILILLFIFLPLQLVVVKDFLTYRAGEHSHLTFVDFAIITALTLGFYGAGLYMWIRAIYRSINKPKAPVEPEYQQPAMVTS